MDIFAVETHPYADQVFGTSGIRKKVSIFRQEHYVANIVQSVFDCLHGIEGKTLVIGGDGRYYNHEAMQIIIKMAVANQFGHIIVGQNGLLSTPATSHLITKHQAFGGFILTASHNPGGKDGDFGIKYNIETGAPAPVELTQLFAQRMACIDRYWTLQTPDIDLSKVGEQTLAGSLIEVVDSVEDYAKYMTEIFDFDQIRTLFQKGFTFTFDAMNAITGPYAKRLFEQMLGAPAGSVINATPLPDFGGRHPEPNLVYAKDLVALAYGENAPDLCAASDGDGDRYMILGKSCFVHPADSLAVLAQYLEKLPFYKGRFYGVAHSRATSGAVDFVCQSLGKKCYQTPTGWKFFGSLLENKYITLCGEESFGAGSFHVMEKDGLWAILCWLNILAITQKTPQQLLDEMWKKHGRIYNRTINYTTDKADKAHHLLDSLTAHLQTLQGQKINDFTLIKSELFDYEDPVSHEISPNQGLIVSFQENAEIMIRPSGTSASGATIKVYLHKYDRTGTLSEEDALGPLATLVPQLLDIPHYLGNHFQQVIT